MTEQQEESITTVKMGINSALSGLYKPDSIKASITNMSMMSSILATQGGQLHNFILIHEVRRGNVLTYDMITDPKYMYAIYNDNVLPVEVKETIRQLHAYVLLAYLYCRCNKECSRCKTFYSTAASKS